MQLMSHLVLVFTSRKFACALFWDYVSLKRETSCVTFKHDKRFSDNQISKLEEVNITYLSRAGTLLLCISILYR